MENKIETGFKIITIFLVESSFTRIPNINFDSTNKKFDVEINIDCDVNSDKPNIVGVQLTLIFKQLSGDVEEVSANISMLGFFEKFGEVPIDILEYGYINGAATMFPYIREHLSSYSLKANIKPLLLPPFNFVQNYIDKIKPDLEKETDKKEIKKKVKKIK